jgi:hypothetical protein
MIKDKECFGIISYHILLKPQDFIIASESLPVFQQNEWSTQLSKWFYSIGIFLSSNFDPDLNLSSDRKSQSYPLLFQFLNPS